jgi:hypothetical protein
MFARFLLALDFGSYEGNTYIALYLQYKQMCFPDREKFRVSMIVQFIYEAFHIFQLVSKWPSSFILLKE